ncbi:MAG: cupin-like domain-containing protein [Geminicoccaceae bacterium]|jgi:hypothetical protein
MFTTSPVTRVERLSSEAFINDYKNTATPVVLTRETESWPARKKWSLDYFKETIGDNIVPLYNSTPSKGKAHQHAAAVHMPMRDYLKKLENGEKDLRMFFYNILSAAPELVDDIRYPDCGLKFFKKLPVLFVGGEGARVQMHYDIDLANIMLCHFGGKKTVLLFSPEQTPYLYKVPFSFSSLFDIDYSDPDFQKYPALKHVRGQVAELEHGDIMFIPSGYWHYICYDEIGFSLSLRAFPNGLSSNVTLLKNIFVTRTVEGVMRKVVGQPWNDRNERLAVERTHRAIGL